MNSTESVNNLSQVEGSTASRWDIYGYTKGLFLKLFNSDRRISPYFTTSNCPVPLVLTFSLYNDSDGGYSDLWP